MVKKTIYVIGAGSGLGNHVAKKFGENDFRVVLMARNEKSLMNYQKEFEKLKIETYIYPVDVSNNLLFVQALESLQLKIGTPDIVVYNIGVTTLDEQVEINSSLLLERYQLDVVSGFSCLDYFRKSNDFINKNGIIIFTGGGVALNPSPRFLPLSMDKAALRAMVYALHDELIKENIFVGLITICGGIKTNTHFDPALIANEYWKMYHDRKQIEIIYK